MSCVHWHVMAYTTMKPVVQSLLLIKNIEATSVWVPKIEFLPKHKRANCTLRFLNTKTWKDHVVRLRTPAWQPQTHRISLVKHMIPVHTQKCLLLDHCSLFIHSCGNLQQNHLCKSGYHKLFLSNANFIPNQAITYVLAVPLLREHLIDQDHG